MSRHAVVLFAGAGMVAMAGVAALLIYSIRAGVAPVTIPIVALVLGPALAAAAMVATCSMVAPPPRPQPVMHTVELISVPRDDSTEIIG